MRFALSTVVTLQDLKSYFTGEHWKMFDIEDGVKGQSEAYDIQVTQQTPTFNVEITATDDPSDSDQKVTDDPVGFITQFLSTGEGAEDLLKKMSFYADPKLLTSLLRRAANLAEMGHGLRRVAAIVRRGAVLMDGHRVRPFLAAIVAAVEGKDPHRSQEMERLQKEMKSKGWQVTQDVDKNGHPMLVVDVSGLYEARIELDSIMWNYSYQVHDAPDSLEKGMADDPIAEFRKFYKSESTQEAKKSLKEKKQQKADEGTAPAPGSKGKKPQSDKSPAPDKSRSETETGDTVFAPTQIPPSRVPNVPKGNKYSDEE